MLFVYVQIAIRPKRSFVIINMRKEPKVSEMELKVLIGPDPAARPKKTGGGRDKEGIIISNLQ